MSNAEHSPFKKKKILRDLIHGYINLEDLDLKVIDTPHFQRLKDIRQLTCQHVYPDARHTRFEHSLGVMELTRQAIKHIKSNRYLTSRDDPGISEKLERDTALAALLHDIGHFPFSHLGEEQLRNDKSLQALTTKTADLLEKRQKKYPGLEDPKLKDLIIDHKMPHELLSCYIILRVYFFKIKLFVLQEKKRIGKKEKDDVDFGFIIRCILGKPYENPSVPDIKIKNVMIGLINSEAFDMDKLDYIMRDSFYTGISVPAIDTKRLFNNMCLSNQTELVFKSKAVPVLQSIIETRDNLYLWVYNHHTVVYTDFLYSYIFRRLAHNAIKLSPKPGSRRFVHNTTKFKLKLKIKSRRVAYNAGKSWFNLEKTQEPASIKDLPPGIMDQDVLFSANAITRQLVSDSTLRYYLTYSYKELRSKYRDGSTNENASETDKCMKRALPLLSNLFERQLLKPWWKTLFEYENFMHSKIPDDVFRTEIASRICNEEGGDEFRSQIAKGVIGLSEKLHKEGVIKRSLHDGDFFLVQRSNRFYSLNAIEKIKVYLYKNEITKSTDGSEYQDGDYYGKFFYNLLPQKDYEKFFEKVSFYIYIHPYQMPPYSKDLIEKKKTKKDRRIYYDVIEDLFVNIASYLVSLGETEFDQYCINYDRAKKNDKIPQELYKIYKYIYEKYKPEEKKPDKCQTSKGVSQT
jgi:HD superfamily phosphohydrolase